MGILDDLLGTPVKLANKLTSAAAEEARARDLFNRLGAGGGGGGNPDWYLRGNLDNDTRQLDLTEQNNLFNQQLNDAQFQHKKAMDARDYALAVGDQELAKQKQASADHWEKVGLEVQQAMNAANNAADIEQANIGANASMYGSRVSAQASLAAAQMRAQTDMQASRNQLQANLANAVNDADRNRAIALFNQEQAAIAKMEDDTKRMLGVQQNQTAQFAAETDRAGVMGNLAQKQNEFILNAATSPRDLFGLYFMQRGVTPDWEAIKNGNPAIGDPLTVQNALTAYKPVHEAPTHTNTAGAAYNQVGKATGSYVAQSNPYLSMGMSEAGGGSGGGSSPSFTMPDFGYSTPASSGYNPGGYKVPVGVAPKLQTNINPGGLQGGVPVSGLKPGTNLSTVGGSGAKGSDFVDYPAFYDEAMTKPVGSADSLASGTNVWVRAAGGTDYDPARNMQTTAAPNPNDVPTINAAPKPPPTNIGQPYAGARAPGDYSNPNFSREILYSQPVNRQVGQIDARPAPQMPDYPTQRPATTQPGYTTAPTVMTGDAMAPDPWAGGAKPEMIENPTGAPIRVKDTFQTAADFGIGLKDQMYRPVNNQAQWRNSNDDYLQQLIAKKRAMFGVQSGGSMPQDTQYDMPQIRRFPMGTDMGGEHGMSMGGEQPQSNVSAQHLIAAIQENPQLGAMLVKMMAEQPDTNQADFGTQAPPQRFALGTDAGQSYANAGMGSLYLQSSGNAHLNGQETAPWIKTLADQGVPISPSLQASTTGQIAPNLNMGAAFTQRGGGGMASLQSLNNMSKGEMENYRGYAEGVVGIPWADMVDYLGRPTKNLQTAGRAKASFGY